MARAYRFPSGALTLTGYLAQPPSSVRAGTGTPAVVLVHGYPSGVGGAASALRTFPELADRIAAELGFLTLVCCCRGAAESEGNFALGGWLEDVVAAVDHVAGLEGNGGVWLAGFGTGGGLALCAGARDQRVRGVAAMATPTDFDDWAVHPRRLLEHAREIGLVSDPSFPPSFDAWSRDLRAIRPVQCAAQLAPRPLLVVHGTDDELVPDFDARIVADAHASAEVRILAGAGHQLRHDPRAVAILLGWLDREFHESVAGDVGAPAPGR